MAKTCFKRAGFAFQILHLGMNNLGVIFGDGNGQCVLANECGRFIAEHGSISWINVFKRAFHVGTYQPLTHGAHNLFGEVALFGQRQFCLLADQRVDNDSAHHFNGLDVIALPGGDWFLGIQNEQANGLIAKYQRQNEGRADALQRQQL